ncbi:MAG: ribonuclease Y [Bacilli bacterium]
MQTELHILFFFIGTLIGIIGYAIVDLININRGKKRANLIIDNAKKEAEVLKKEVINDAKENMRLLKDEQDSFYNEKKDELKLKEESLNNREESLNKRDDIVVKKEDVIEEKERNIIETKKEIQEEKKNIDNRKKAQDELLESISKMTKLEAKNILFENLENELEKEMMHLVKEKENIAKMEVNRTSKKLLVSCMQKYSNDVVSEKTVSVVNLPSDDIKGKIIGREGRNIRTIESVTGVDLIIDDTPDVIVLSSFDPYRREIARLTLEELIKDGRIHPARIEEVFNKSNEEVDLKVREYGETAIYELGLTKIEPELIEYIGRLFFRTSYGQNVLQHSIEVANFAGMLAAEMGENITLAKRAGLLHDIGKAVNLETEGSHVEVGYELAKRFGEGEVVLNAIMSHHGDEEEKFIISSLVSIADTLSAARPGARNDVTENYLKRLKQLEEIAYSFDGVEKSYAVSAGREIRVLVNTEIIDDFKCHKLARTIKDKIENEMQYPGTIKVTVIRETRVEEEAK